MLKITATGNLTNDVELKMNETTGKPYAILRIASDRRYAGAGRLDQDERPDHPAIDGTWLIIVKQVIHPDLISTIRFWLPMHLGFPHTVEHNKLQHLVLSPPKQNAPNLPNQGNYPG